MFTDWEKCNYWEKPKEAPYPKMSYKRLSGWNELIKNLPLPGLGIYGHYRQEDCSREPFVYLQVNSMRYDINSEEPSFSFKPTAKSKTESIHLTNSLPPQFRKLFSDIDAEELVKILSSMGETPPPEWMRLIEVKEMPVSWHDYVGKYFLGIETENISNDEFEDRVGNLLKALGFDVTQKGHTLPGAYADGISSFDNYAVVYDCKNTSNFFLSEEDKRAIEKYLQDEKKVRKEKNVYSAFIAKSFRQPSKGDLFYFTVNSLIYLLYKKLLLGPKFTLDPIKKILDNKTPLTNEIIDKEWRV